METTEAVQIFSQNESILDINNKAIHSFDFPQNVDAFTVTMAILHIVVCILGLGGNSLVIVAVLKMDKMSSATSVYIFNLALADGLFMVGLPFIAFQNFQNQWIFGNLACKIIMVLDGINQFTSVFCLMVMSMDRYMALVDPLRFASWRTPKWAKIISAFLWLFSLILVLPMALHFTVQYDLCMADMFMQKWWITFLVYSFVLGFILPLLVMTIFYTSLVLTLRIPRQWDRNSTSQESQKFEKQITKMVVAVVAVFGICWMPFYVFNFCSVYGTNMTITFARGFEIAVLLSYSWSCANPILYSCLSKTFQRYFHLLLCSQKNSPRINCNQETDGYDLHFTNQLDVNVLA